jgi:hypothetical protein
MESLHGYLRNADIIDEISQLLIKMKENEIDLIERLLIILNSLDNDIIK